MNSPESDANTVRRAPLSVALRHGVFLLLERMLRWCIHPRLRARLLALFGASIGRNVRVYEIQLFNLEQGFHNLILGDDVHVGPGCRLDLAGRLMIGNRTTLSPGVTILTHADAGSAHGSRLLAWYPAKTAAVSIGADCWLGAGAIVLAGVRVGDVVVVAAGSVLTSDAPTEHVVAGAPAVVKKRLV